MNKTITCGLMALALSMGASTAVAAPVILADHVKEALPPIDRPFTLKECAYGMGYVAFAMDIKLTLVGICKEPLELYYEDEETPLFSIPATNNIYNSQYVECPIQEDGTSNIVIWFSRAGVNTPGKYRLEVPGSYFKSGDIYTKPATFTYNLVEEAASATFEQIFTASVPVAGKPFQPKDELVKGLGTVTLDFSRNVELNSDDSLVISLKADNAAEGAYSAGHADVKVEQDGEGSHAVITFVESGITEPGEYVLTVPDGFFLIDGVPVLGGTLNYTLRAVGEAPRLSELIEDVVPPVDVPFTEDNYSTGVQNITLTLDGKFTLNKDCQTPAVFSRDGEQLYEMLAGKNFSEGVPYAYMNPTDPNHPKLMFIFLWGKLVVPGHYELVIPDGYLLCDGEEVAGTTLNFNLKAPLTLESIITESKPVMNTPFDPAVDGPVNGLSNISLSVDKVITANKECEAEATLTKEGVEEPLYRIKATNTNVPYLYCNKNGADKTTLMFIFLWGNLTEPGTYTLNVPDGFLLCDGEKVRGGSFTYIISDGEAPAPALADLIEEIVPPVDEPFTVEQFSNGVGSVTLTLDGKFTLNKECETPAVFSRDGETIHKVPAGKPFQDGVPYPYVSPTDPEHPKLMFIFEWAPGITDPGHYELVIPDGYLLLDGVEVAGTTLNFYLEAPALRLEDMITKSAPAMDTPFDPAVDGPQNGLSYIYLYVDKVVVANKDCEAEATLTKEDVEAPVFSFKASAGSVPYLYCNKGGDTTTLMFIFLWGNFTEPGIYTLNVPDGFILCDDKEVKGGSFTYIMTSGEDTVDSIAAGFGEGKRMYRLDGTEVKEKYPVPGIYVIDGKKVIINRR